MEWVKLFVESYLQLIHYFAWPTVVLICLFVLRKPVSGLLQRIIKIGKGDFYAELLVDELKAKITEKVKFSEVTEKTYTWENYLDTLEQWAMWIIFFANEACSHYTPYNMPEVIKKHVLSAIGQFNMVVKKIEEERPKSEVLEGLHNLKDTLEKNINRYEQLKKEKIAGYKQAF